MSGATTDKPVATLIPFAIVNGDAQLLRRMTEEALSYLKLFDAVCRGRDWR